MLCSLANNDTVNRSPVGRMKFLTVLMVSLSWKKWAESLSRGDRLLCLGKDNPGFDLCLDWACFRRPRTDTCSGGKSGRAEMYFSKLGNLDAH